jgi:hypothetical protein
MHRNFLPTDLRSAGRGCDKLSYLFCGIAKELFNVKQVEIGILPREICLFNDIFDVGKFVTQSRYLF